MNVTGELIKRNVKMFFKDKGTFFTSLITPIILLVLYVTFLYKVYKSSFLTAFPAQFQPSDELMNGLVGGLLLSSLLAVSTVTVSFCANLFMVQDKVTGAKKDFTVAPVPSYSLALGYYFATVINGLIISLVATALGLIYLSIVGWYLSFADVLCMLLDVLLLVLFGTALSSLICYPLTTQGQISAVGSVVSSGYGFICGAYMPISQFAVGVQNVLMFLPGTYATSLIRNHTLKGVYAELSAQGFPKECIDAVKGIADCNLDFFGHNVEIWQMYLILIGAILLLIGGYVLLVALTERKKNTSKK